MSSRERIFPKIYSMDSTKNDLRFFIGNDREINIDEFNSVNKGQSWLALIFLSVHILITCQDSSRNKIFNSNIIDTETLCHGLTALFIVCDATTLMPSGSNFVRNFWLQFFDWSELHLDFSEWFSIIQNKRNLTKKNRWTSESLSKEACIESVETPTKMIDFLL